MLTDSSPGIRPVSYTHLDVYKRQDQASPAALIEKYAPGGTLEDVYLTIFGEDEA